MDLLDDTRIHPLQYSIAIELSKAAWLAAQNLSEDEANPDDLEMAVQEVAGQLASELYFLTTCFVGFSLRSVRAIVPLGVVF